MIAFSGPAYCGLRVENPASPSWRTYISHAASPLISAPIAGQPAACCIQTSENWVRRICARRTRSSSGSVTSYRTLLIFSSMSFSPRMAAEPDRSEEHTSELQSQSNLVCRLLLEKKKHEPHSRLCARFGRQRRGPFPAGTRHGDPDGYQNRS